MTYQQLWQPLTAVSDAAEARAVARWLLEVCFGLTTTDVACGEVERLQGADLERLLQMQQRLLQGEPVQYVAGTALFGPRRFSVSPAVLIPRPETYELCLWIEETATHRALSQRRILDVGTGSGCIACTLALDLDSSELTAWDISAEALAVAALNADKLGANVRFEQRDALQATPSDKCLFDYIVSNPPYVCHSECTDMQPQVLHHEPHQALFVPDDDPLRFYRAIARYAWGTLVSRGLLFFELNAAHAEATSQLMQDMGYADVELRHDQFGQPRFLKATHP